MRGFLVGLFTLLIVVPVFSQDDTLSIVDRIASMDFSKSDIISKSRRLLLQDFHSGNREEVRRTMQYLDTEIDDEYHLSLWDYERYLLLYWLGDYQPVILSIELAAEDTTITHVRPSVYPSDHVLGETLQNEIKDRYYEDIINDYKSLYFTDDTNDFLYMFLNCLLNNSSQTELNRLSDEFVKNYPYSPLVEATKKYVSYKLAAGDYGFGMTMGGGLHFLSGSIKDYIHQKGGINLNIDLYYKKFYLGLGVIGSFGKTQQNIALKQNGEIWYAGEDINISRLYIALGVKAWEYKRFNLLPIAGISFNSANYYIEETKTSSKDIKLGTSVTPVVGFDLDFRLNNLSPYRNYYTGFYNSQTIIYTLGLKTAYYPNLIATQGKELRGQNLFIGLSLKMNIYSLKRVF